jgi:aminopeptidase N
MKRLLHLCLLFLLSPLSHAEDSATVIHHELDVRLTPSQASIEVRDRLTLPHAVTRLEFFLHGELDAGIVDTDARLTAGKLHEGEVPVRGYSVEFPRPASQFTLSYRGRIDHPLRTHSLDYAGGREGTPGAISDQGVFLSISSYWFPVIQYTLNTFDMKLDLPAGWRSVSQGSRGATTESWRETVPQDDIYLIAAPYHYYQEPTEIALAEAYLHKDDPELASRYLQATGEYLELYQELLGPYPFSKFSLVENFWESGYGMPSFTLLGPMVIRLPFIIHTSYPHEILHNWWGNGVYVDYASGNWSEGLTTYLSDHLLKEMNGQGAGYRRDALQRYADFISDSQDFPASRFRGNHGQVSQAVGYGKTMMFFHMLRRRLGGDLFIQGLRHFYAKHRFRHAGFSDLRLAFESVSGQSLGEEFDQWLNRTGAPTLDLQEVSGSEGPSGYRLEITLKQVQPEAVYKLQVPLFIQVEGSETPVERVVAMDAREARIGLDLDKRPLRLSVDPRFELFRQLHQSEIPSSLGQLFGAGRLSIVLPDGAPPSMLAGYRNMAEAWSRRHSGIDVLHDSELERLPPDRSVWIFGRDNRFRHLFDPLLETQGIPIDDQSLAVTRRHPDNPNLTLGIVSAKTIEAMPGLMRKLPHYSRYSYVTFTGDTPSNREKGQWQSSDSVLTMALTNEDALDAMEIPPLRPLAVLPSRP